MNENILEQFRTLKLLRVFENKVEPFDMVLIKFHDNDFHSTFYPLLESVLNYLAFNACYQEPIPDQFIEQMIRQGIDYHYRFFQMGSSACRFLRDGLVTPEFANEQTSSINPTRLQYLNGIKILFNDDAKAVLHNCDNGENWLLNISTAEIITY